MSETNEKWAYSTSLTNDPLHIFPDRFGAMWRAYHDSFGRAFKVEIDESGHGELSIRSKGRTYDSDEAAVEVAPYYAKKRAYWLGKIE